MYGVTTIFCFEASLVVMDVQVKKFGDSSRIKLIAKEAGSALTGTTVSSQTELWDSLVNGCKDAVRRAGADSKVCKLTYPFVNFRIVFASFGQCLAYCWSLLLKFTFN